MTTARKYFTLVTRDNAGEPWGIHFGSYDRESVDIEQDDVTHWAYKRSDTKILTTTDEMGEIDAAVVALNLARPVRDRISTLNWQLANAAKNIMLMADDDQAGINNPTEATVETLQRALDDLNGIITKMVGI